MKDLTQKHLFTVLLELELDKVLSLYFSLFNNDLYFTV